MSLNPKPHSGVQDTSDSFPQSDTPSTRISLDEEYRLLHEVADILQTPKETRAMLRQVMKTLTGFQELDVESKAGVFLADSENRVLRLYTTYGEFTDEFLEKEREVPFGDCLCGRAAESGQLLMSDSCFSDDRHERRFQDMTPHGHYIIPLKSRNKLIGILFLYTRTDPTWYRFSQEVLLSIGGLIAGAIERQLNEEELGRYRKNLESIVEERTAELTAMREQLRKLNQWMEEVREEEKKRISREVHDQLGQSLTALSLDLSWLGKRIEEGEAPIRDKIQEMRESVKQTIGLTQKIAAELRPPVLDLMGLSETLAWQARQMEQRTGIACRVEIDNGLQFESGLSTAIFRIFQETLTNITRHAKAKEVDVTFKRNGKSYELTVKDDGCGMDPEKLKAPGSLGLMGMRERALIWDGTVEIESSPGCGTLVRVSIPVASGEY
ncbi:MAG: GAF domain-containing sensor histidine kinase [Candidatus Nitronauta litoralis]|uniref:histidine kinase n=1 Tax=Candidatus Nitronauta litoralis TaxID=2705533 RepID=A0A7T0BUG4_9BACT|nr:MAG: GAF domain-containing sensor histidine kinase [Candidatus Nitronauta litoralis]